MAKRSCQQRMAILKPSGRPQYRVPHLMHASFNPIGFVFYPHQFMMFPGQISWMMPSEQGSWNQLVSNDPDEDSKNVIDDMPMKVPVSNIEAPLPSWKKYLSYLFQVSHQLEIDEVDSHSDSKTLDGEVVPYNEFRTLDDDEVVPYREFRTLDVIRVDPHSDWNDEDIPVHCGKCGAEGNIPFFHCKEYFCKTSSKGICCRYCLIERFSENNHGMVFVWENSSVEHIYFVESA